LKKQEEDNIQSPLKWEDEPSDLDEVNSLSEDSCSDESDNENNFDISDPN